MNKFSKTAALALSALLISSAFAVGCGDEPGQQREENTVAVWGAEDTFKALRDNSYTERHGNKAEIRISAVRNEVENAQIILTPQKSVTEYTLALSDFKASGGAVFSKDNFKVYNQKYIDVTKTTTNRFSAGYYPDALLPFETAVAYGENKVAAGENQGIWFECRIPEQQAAGEYTGNFKITIDGEVRDVPVTVKVFDYTLSDTVHSRSSFGVHRYWNEGGIVSAEKDASYDMYALYYEYLLEHRISTRYLPAAMSDIDGFIVQLRKYVKSEKCSNYILPYVSKWDNAISGTGIDYELYERQFDAIAEACIQDNYNYLAKASTYFAMFDEITAAGAIATANKFYTKIYKLHFDIAKRWETSLDCDAEFKAELIQSMLDVTQLMVTSYNKNFGDQLTFCPLLDKYDASSSRALYQKTYVIADDDSDYRITQNDEKWWYSAGIPKNPYASYHIDDNGYSPIVYSWMQYANDVVGNLYWSTTFYLVREKENNVIVHNTLQDCYTTAMRFPNTNGDGFLVYPGAPYGIKGPVGCVRLQQLLDGLEEYDMLYALEQKYEQLKGSGVPADFDAVMQFFYERLFSGTRVSSSEQTYEQMRERLLELITLAENTGALITDAALSENDVDVTLFIPAGATAQFSGTEQSRTAVTGGNIVKVRMPLSASESDFSLTVNGHTARLLVDGKYVEYSGNALKNMFTANNGTVEYSSDGAVFTFPASADKRHSFTFAKTLAEQITQSLRAIKMEITVDSECSIEVLFNGSGMTAALPVATGRLEAGYNEFTVNVSTLNWASLGTVTGVTVRIGGSGDNTARLLAVNSLVLQ